MAIAAPSFLKFFAGQKSDVARDALTQSIQEAQIKAQQNNATWQFSVRENGNIVEVSVHPSSVLASASAWRSLDKSVQLDEETTFLNSGHVYYVRFDEKGNVRRSRLGRVTISSKQFPEIKRCVIVSTLLGATRVAKEQSTPDPNYSVRDRFCY